MAWFTKTYTWSTDLAQGIGIRADRHDAQDNLFVNGISAAWCVDPTVNGSAYTTNLPTTTLNLNTQRITNASNGIAGSDYATVNQISGASGSPHWAGTATGTANALILTLAPAIATYGTGGLIVEFIAGANNTGATTVNVSGLGNKAVKINGTQALLGGEFVAGEIYQIQYDGTNFQITSSLAGTLTQSGTSLFRQASGTGDAIIFTSIPSFTPQNGSIISFVAPGTNTISPTINVNGIGAQSIFKDNTQNLKAGDLVSGAIYEIIQYGGSWNILSPISGVVTQRGETIYAVDTGAVNAIAVAFLPVITTATLQPGMTFRIKIIITNTGATTIAVGGGATVPVKKLVSSALVAGDLLTNQISEFTYDGTNFQLMSPLGNNVTNIATAGLATGGPITSTGTVTVTAATVANQRTATSNTVAVTSAVQNSHPSSVKAFISLHWNGASFDVYSSYNFNSPAPANYIAVGKYRLVFTNPMFDTGYIVNITCATNSQIGNGFVNSAATFTTGEFQANTQDSTSTFVDFPWVMISVCGNI